MLARNRSSFEVPVEDDIATKNRLQNFCIADVVGVDLEQILVEDDHVGVFADLDRAKVVFDA